MSGGSLHFECLMAGKLETKSRQVFSVIRAAVRVVVPQHAVAIKENYRRLVPQGDPGAIGRGYATGALRALLEVTS